MNVSKASMQKLFIMQALRRFKQIGAVFPTSKYAVRRICASLPQDSKTFLEYGAGTGVITHALLQKKNVSSITAIEINPYFVKHLLNIRDKRLKVVQGDVLEKISSDREILKQRYDVILSGIPLSFLPSKQRRKILAQTRRLLNENGCLIIYQTSPFLYPLLKEYFSSLKTTIVLRNFPPYWIFTAQHSFKIASSSSNASDQREAHQFPE